MIHPKIQQTIQRINQIELRGFFYVSWQAKQSYFRGLHEQGVSSEDVDKIILSTQLVCERLNLSDGVCLRPGREMEKILLTGGQVFA